MAATDFFGRAVNNGDVVWVPATVQSTTGTSITVKPNGSAQNVEFTIASGTAGESTNPSEGDRPPK